MKGVLGSHQEVKSQGDEGGLSQRKCGGGLAVSGLGSCLKLSEESGCLLGHQSPTWVLANRMELWKREVFKMFLDFCELLFQMKVWVSWERKLGFC